MERAIIRRCREGDPDAYGDLVALFGDAVAQTTFAILADAHEAQDAAQETWLRVYRHLDQFREDAEFRPWLLTIAANEAYSRRRLLWRARRIVLRQQGAVRGAPSSGPDHDWAMDVMVAIRRLPQDQATAILLRYFHDLTVPQIASSMGRPEGTIKAWLSRALVSLRRDINVANEETVLERISHA